MPPELGVELGPVRLKHPVVCGSGEHVSSLDQLKATVDAAYYAHKIMSYGLQAFAVAS